MTTTKQPKAKPVKRRKPTPPEDAPEERSTVIPLPEDCSAEEAKDTLARIIPGWDDLTKAQQVEVAKLALAHHSTPQPVKVTMKRKPDGGHSIGIAGKCETQGLLKLQKAFGAVSMEPVNARANELLNYLGSVGADNVDRYNAALSFIESMQPQNQAEALLLVQMYVTHDAAIRSLSQLGKADWVPQMQTFGNLAVKLMRLSQRQMETLARMRRGGEQVVRHIHVDNRGGQAVIAETVNTGGQANGKTANQSHATGAPSIGPALLGADPFGSGVPISGGEGPEAVQNARWHEPGGAER